MFIQAAVNSWNSYCRDRALPWVQLNAINGTRSCLRALWRYCHFFFCLQSQLDDFFSCHAKLSIVLFVWRAPKLDMHFRQQSTPMCIKQRKKNEWNIKLQSVTHLKNNVVVMAIKSCRNEYKKKLHIQDNRLPFTRHQRWINANETTLLQLTFFIRNYLWQCVRQEQLAEKYKHTKCHNS